MKLKSIAVALASSISTAGTSLAAQSWAEDYTHSLHPQLKVNTHDIKPWFKGYEQSTHSWEKLNNSGLKPMYRMYNHGIKRV